MTEEQRTANAAAFGAVVGALLFTLLMLALVYYLLKPRLKKADALLKEGEETLMKTRRAISRLPGINLEKNQ